MAGKLELTWYGKDKPLEIEPRLLIENAKLSHQAASSGELFDDGSAPAATMDNLLIHGDNLLALKALEAKYAGQVKCIYIDPPYNTGSAFEHYDDNLEHSQWLNLMRPRLEILRNLLSADGSIWINLDDNEVHYCKIMMDEIMGRNNFLCDLAWEKRYSPPPDTKEFGYIHDHILIYRKSPDFKRNLLPLTEDQTGRYKNPDNDPRGPWKAMDYTCRFTSTQRPNLFYPIIQPITKEEVFPKETRVWANSKEEHEKNVRENRLWWGVTGKNRIPAKKNFLSDIQQGMMPMSLWHYNFAGTNQDAKKESLALFGKNAFGTPKPEKLISLILHVASSPGDLVLDSFLGSGTTAAVAHKMGRRWIGIEMGEHAYTHCKVRLDKVIDGTDAGGITKAVNWKGGGGYRFYELAPTLINLDPFGEAVINTDYSPDMLAAAMALHEGFTYQPDAGTFWKQAFANEKSFLFTTTRHLTAAYLDSIRSTMAEDEYLVIACRSFEAGLDKASDRITIRKIPQMLLSRCEFGRTDYALNIVHPPMLEDGEETEEDHE